jgi:FkbM family methyltransferase
VGVGYKLRQIIREHRRSVPLRLIAMSCEKYLRVWYNEDFWEFESNGEAFVLSRFNQWAQGREVVIWDVGAHHGEWAEAAHKLVPSAAVHSFEIVPEAASQLTDTDWWSTYAFGLSDVEDVVDVYWNNVSGTNSSINPRSETVGFEDGLIIRCRVKTGDQLVDELGSPDFVKIDVEGHEAFVLRGLRQTLRGRSAPRLIQFEYGATYVPSGSTLREIYALLPNYSIGRLFPNYVDFKPYDYSGEHLRMGNMIATRDQGLQSLLAGKVRQV